MHAYAIVAFVSPPFAQLTQYLLPVSLPHQCLPGTDSPAPLRPPHNSVAPLEPTNLKIIMVKICGTQRRKLFDAHSHYIQQAIRFNPVNPTIFRLVQVKTNKIHSIHLLRLPGTIKQKMEVVSF